MIKNQPLTREEQMMIRATENKEQAEEMMMYIAEQRKQGKAVG